jgi:polyisoprenyl-teichoic acid--peptidoglycan teichoic acid transferase
MKEFFKTSSLVVIFLTLLGLLIFLPQSRAFGTQHFLPSSLINLGHVFRFTFGRNTALQSDQDGWTNILVMGIPGEGNPAPELTDSIILASFKNDKIVFLSIPRDLYVKPTKDSYYRKINSLLSANFSLQQIKEVIYDITGRRVHYCITVNLDLIKALTRKLGGINILVKEDIVDPTFPGPNYSYDPFYLKKGWRHLDAETAVKYVRTRYDSEGDYGRMKRQQQFLAAIKQKISNLNSFQNFDFILSLYQDFQEHIKTDMTINEIKNLWQKSKDTDLANAQAIRLTASQPSLLKESFVSTFQGRMFVLVPRAGLGNYTQISNFIKQYYE